MKTLILYATKHGASREIADRVSKLMGSAVTHDLKQKDIPELSEYDCVIVGSSIYAGMIRKEAKAYVRANTAALKEKTLGLFISGMDAEKQDEYFTANFPPELLKSAKGKAFLGGVFDPDKAGAIGKLIVKLVKGKAQYMNTVDDAAIERFTEKLKG